MNVATGQTGPTEMIRDQERFDPFGECAQTGEIASSLFAKCAHRGRIRRGRHVADREGYAVESDGVVAANRLEHGQRPPSRIHVVL